MREQVVDSFSLSAVSSSGNDRQAFEDRFVGISEPAGGRQRRRVGQRGDRPVRRTERCRAAAAAPPRTSATAIAGARGAEIRPASASVATAAASPDLG